VIERIRRGGSKTSTSSARYFFRLAQRTKEPRAVSWRTTRSVDSLTRLPRSAPSAYSRRGRRGEQGHTGAKGGGRQNADAVLWSWSFTPRLRATAAELRNPFGANPFLGEQFDPKTLHLAFLADRPTATRVRALDPDRSPADRFVLRGREIYLCLPNGVARSKLNDAYLDSTLGTTSTLRNWKTVTRLVEMVDRESLPRVNRPHLR